jgi:hypothetical protein
MRILIAILTAATLVFGATSALAAEWTVTKLRGTVLLLVDGAWEPIARGAIVPEHRIVRTVRGRVTLQRGNETIDLGPQTQISIDDRGGPKPFTTVTQHFGHVQVEAEVKDVRHFAVRTPFLVAVVKGTRFAVQSGKNGSKVAVQRGAVLIVDPDSSSSVTVGAGQSASTQASKPLTVAGRGKLPEVDGPKGSGKSNAGGNGNGNARDNSNGNARDNSNGNAGGDGAGNAGSNGESNAGGSGTSNAGSNGQGKVGGGNSV